MRRRVDFLVAPVPAHATPSPPCVISERGPSAGGGHSGFAIRAKATSYFAARMKSLSVSPLILWVQMCPAPSGYCFFFGLAARYAARN
jgi:hypothetical protein